MKRNSLSAGVEPQSKSRPRTYFCL